MDAHVALVVELAGQLAGGRTDMDALWGVDLWDGDEWLWNLGTMLAAADRWTTPSPSPRPWPPFITPTAGSTWRTRPWCWPGRAGAPRPALGLRPSLPMLPTTGWCPRCAAKPTWPWETFRPPSPPTAVLLNSPSPGGQPDEVQDTFELLASFHESAGQANEARAAREQLDSWRRESGWLTVAVPPVRRGPKVGRNEPCPCGSGRKFKRCCGGSLT